jgi:hemolysin III
MEFINAKLKELSVEEVANTLTHGFGLLLSVAGFIFLVALAVMKGDRWHIASSLVYGASLVILYAASTCYHTITDARLKRRLQIVDHCCIYLLIAGSYTPFALIVLREGVGGGLLAVVWAAAIFGIAVKIIFRGRYRAVGMVLYLAMGWIGVIAVQPLYIALGMAPLVMLVGGGLSYTFGVIFFGLHRIRHNHAIFHVFVLGGSIMHYLAIAIYVFP